MLEAIPRQPPAQVTQPAARLATERPAFVAHDSSRKANEFQRRGFDERDGDVAIFRKKLKPCCTIAEDLPTNRGEFFWKNRSQKD